MSAGTRSAVALLTLAWSASAGAQALAARIAGAAGDVVQFHYAARQGVCGDGRAYIRIDGGFWSTSYGNFSSDMTACANGPVRVLISKDHGDVIRIQTVAGPLAPVTDATDLGAVSGAEAGRYFVGLANTLEGRPARSAVLAGAIADSADISDQLMTLARNPDKARDLRSSALTWASRRAGVAGAARMATALNAIAVDANERQAMRTSALTSLGGLDGGAGVAALITLSDRTDDAWLAGEAASALAQSNDTRVRPQLRKLLDNRATPEASRVKVISALGNSDGTVRDAEAIRTAYPKMTEKERNAAISALGNIGDHASVAWMLDRAKDPAEALNVRHAAIQRAARAGARAPELISLFDSGAIIERTLREAIVDALAEDGSRAALDKILSIAQSTSGDATLRKHAITKLGDSGDPRAKELLQTLIGR